MRITGLRYLTASFTAEPFYEHEVTEAECGSENHIFPNLLLHRITNHEDSQGHLHHGYQIMYLGDYWGPSKGLLKAKLLNETKVLVEIPSLSSSWFRKQSTVQGALREYGALTKDVEAAYSTSARRIRANPTEMLSRVVIDFGPTGERLTNEIFSLQRSAMGSSTIRELR